METENLQEKIALIFGWSHERVLQTRFPKIIEKLVEIVEDYEKIIQMQKEEIEEEKRKLKESEKIITRIDNFLNEERSY